MPLLLLLLMLLPLHQMTLLLLLFLVVWTDTRRCDGNASDEVELTMLNTSNKQTKGSVLQ